MSIKSFFIMLPFLLSTFSYAGTDQENKAIKTDIKNTSIQMGIEILGGNYADAIALGEPYLDDSKNINSENASAMVGILNGLSHAYVKTGKTKQARNAANMLLSILNTHAKTISDYDFLSNIADTFIGIGDYNQAENLFKQKIEMQKLDVGPTSHKIAYTFWDLADVYEKQNKRADAENTYLLAFSIMTNDTEPVEYPAAMLAEKISTFYKNNKNFEKSAYYTTQADELRKKYENANTKQ